MRLLIFATDCLPTIMLLNLLILLCSACIKTVPADNVSFRAYSSRTIKTVVADSSESDLELKPVQNDDSSSTTTTTTSTTTSTSSTTTYSRTNRVAQDDYYNHVKEFRNISAKTFKSLISPDETTTESPHTSKPEYDGYKDRAKTFGLKISNGTVVIASEKENNSTLQEKKDTEADKHRNDNNEIKLSDSDLFDALQVKKTDICASCPQLWMNNNTEMKDLCSNYESVSNFFSMTMDKEEAKKIEDKNDVKECTRTITCKHPHMLVKWHDSDLCDVHAPMTGSQSVETTNSFVYKCNGTHWTMHGFPIKNTICALNTN